MSKAHAPPYDWVCHVCQKVNLAGTDTCQHCGASARMSGGSIEREHKRQLEDRIRGLSLPPYVPNRLPKGERIILIAIALIWTIQAVNGFITGRVVGMGKSSHVEYVGSSAGLMGIALCAYACSLLVRFLDHYDQRNNEATYRFLSYALLGLGLCFQLLAGVWSALTVSPLHA